jgi:hypothetical protein
MERAIGSKANTPMRKRLYCTPLLCIAIASPLLLAGCAPVISNSNALSALGRSQPRRMYPGGRFIVYVPGFLDPAISRPNRKITVMGSVLGKEVHPLGEIKYSYPVIEKKDLHLWPAEEFYVRGPRVHFGVAIGTWF